MHSLWPSTLHIIIHFIKSEIEFIAIITIVSKINAFLIPAKGDQAWAYLAGSRSIDKLQCVVYMHDYINIMSDGR